ncbi:Ig-like domain-containing protein [Pseudocolwellia agarivorans]|uniref:Ig-like domain-containing protein n=1 Tax=Pseudocolwellia agarivorans TaxID=1911682 RepID=UPI00098686B4|nr:Ig-like domain-containing protein [Pseudocolwellia agarivorans]
MRKLSIIAVSLITSSLLLAGCGSEGSVSNEISQSPITVDPSTPEVPSPIIDTNNNSISLAGIQGKNQIQIQKVKGITKPQNAIVDAEFSNAKGDFVYKDNTSSVAGNLTFAINVEEPDQITDISLYLPSVEQTISVCSNNCGTTFNRTLTGFNPQLSGVQAGNLRIELFVTDSAQNTAMLDAISIDWSPIEITGISATRSEDKITVNWQGGSSLNRYNVYSATEANLTPTSVLSLSNGSQQLAINTNQTDIAVIDETSNYYVLITGINEQGESGQSAPFQVAATKVAVNQPPQAVTDNVIIDEDNVLSTNVLDNDIDPENSLLTLDSIITPPVNGQLTFDNAGNISYQPNKDFFGQDSFTYQILDDENNSAQANVLITINNVNDEPIATNDAYTLAINNSLAITSTGLLTNDTDIDGDFLFVDILPVSPPLHGTLQLNSNGSFTYIADSSFIDEDSFEYQVTDNKGGTSSAQVTILSSGSDAPPIALNDIYEINEDTTLIINSINNSILANDKDPNSLSISLNETLLTSTTHGQLNLSIDGTFTYIPAPNFFGIDRFQYEIMNTLGKTSQAFVNITVNPVADIPTANNDNYQINEDITLSINSNSGLLANDSDIDGGTLTVNTTPLVAPQQGSLILNTDGSFTYLPKNNFNGLDTFTYQILNNKGAITTAQASITINPINDAPVAINDQAQTNSETQLILDVLLNDKDIDGDELTIKPFTLDEAYGTVTVENNKLRFVPSVTFGGLAEISYTTSDPSGEESTATLSISVSLVGSLNSDPIGINDTYTLDEDEVLIGSSFLNNDTDSDGGTLTASTTPFTNVSNGTLIINTDGTFIYTPNANYNGTDSFSYRLSDGQGGFNNAQVTLNIDPVNDLPVAVSDIYSTQENTSLTVIASSFNALLKNDTDQDGDSLSINVGMSGNPSFGSLTLSSDGSFTYIPETNFSGIDNFTYQLEDSQGGSTSGNVSINVINVNVAPKAVTDNYTMLEGGALNALSVLSNDTDADGDTLTVDTSFLSSPSNGVVNFASDGTFVYTPSIGFVGSDTFTYKVDDGNGEQDEGLIHITVSTDPSAHGNPLAVTDFYNINQGTILSGSNLLDNDLSDQTNSADTSLLTVTTVPHVAPLHGTLILESNGNFTYTPESSFSGFDSFEYEVRNIYNKTSTVIVTINIASVNTAPKAVADTYVTDENTTLNASSVLNNDTDVDGDALTVSTPLISSPSNGSVSISSDGTFTYTPNTDFVGGDSFTYRVLDTYSEYDDTVVNITVKPSSSSSNKPLARNDFYSVNTNQSLTVNTILDNDDDGQILSLFQLSVEKTRDVEHGTLALQSNGNFTYTPNTDYSGEDFFIYQITNFYGKKSTAKVIITVL